MNDPADPDVDQLRAETRETIDACDAILDYLSKPWYRHTELLWPRRVWAWAKGDIGSL